jgi:hypothetical protein
MIVEFSRKEGRKEGGKEEMGIKGRWGRREERKNNSGKHMAYGRQPWVWH